MQISDFRFIADCGFQTATLVASFKYTPCRGTKWPRIIPKHEDIYGLLRVFVFFVFFVFAFPRSGICNLKSAI
ncbi:MAG: hypothetical protein DMF97_05925 [Acidobacteria bacterium]|nr:MAG: hypothetical protein DMF97_05925 [Acidobacteriota bacterium]